MGRESKEYRDDIRDAHKYYRRLIKRKMFTLSSVRHMHKLYTGYTFELELSLRAKQDIIDGLLEEIRALEKRTRGIQ